MPVPVIPAILFPWNRISLCTLPHMAPSDAPSPCAACAITVRAKAPEPVTAIVGVTVNHPERVADVATLSRASFTFKDGKSFVPSQLIRSLP
jgi:hypothetical protein